MRRRFAALFAVPIALTLTTVPALAAPAPEVTCAVPLGVRTDADGDRHHTFRLPNGIVTDQVVPAADFDPATASPERVAKIGLPPRPVGAASDKISGSDWDRLAQGIKRTQPKAGCVNKGLKATYHSKHYSGYRAFAASGNTYSGAHASYTAPNYYLSGCTDESMTQWVGVSDGYLLVQAGLYVNQSGPFKATAFIEFVHGTWDTDGVYDIPVAYVVGHRYYFDVHYLDRYNWSLTVSDLDAGDSYTATWYNAGAGGTQYLQPQAYFISERLLRSDGYFTQYMSHSDVRFRAATAHIYGAGDARLSVQRPEEMVMLSPAIGDLRLSNVDPLETSGSNFTEHWARCGAVEPF